MVWFVCGCLACDSRGESSAGDVALPVYPQTQWATPPIHRFGWLHSRRLLLSTGTNRPAPKMFRVACVGNQEGASYSYSPEDARHRPCWAKEWRCVGVGHRRLDGGHAGMYWWMSIEFICIVAQSSVQFLNL